MANIGEIKLALKLMFKDKEVPDNIRDAAVEELKIIKMAMSSEELADLYVIDQLIKAIETGDKELLDEVSELIDGGEIIAAMRELLGAGEKKTQDLEIVPYVEKMVYEAAHAFVDDVIVKQGWPEAMGWSALTKLSDRDFVPLKYEDGFLIGFNQNEGKATMFSVNNKLTLDEFVGSNTDHVRMDTRVIDAIKDQWLIDAREIEVDFVNMSLHYMGDGKYEFMTHRAH